MKLSVERLRELARKHLGKGHSRLRTRAQLLAALKEALREPLSRLLDAAESVVPQSRKKVRVVDFPPGRKGGVRPTRTPADAPAASPRAPAPREDAGRTGESRRETAADSPLPLATPETRAGGSPGTSRPALPRSRTARDAATRTRESTVVPGTPAVRQRAPRTGGPRKEARPTSPRLPPRPQTPAPERPAQSGPSGVSAARDALGRASPPRAEPASSPRPPVTPGTPPRPVPAQPEASSRAEASPDRASRAGGAMARSAHGRSSRSAPSPHDAGAANGAPVAGAASTGRSAASVAARRAPAPERPVQEGFFEVPTTPRRPRRPPSPTEPFEAGPFASPREVGTDAPVLLVRDPKTLFVFWDFRHELERGAALGLREPRLLLRIHRGPDLDRTLELPLTARSTYVTGLTSGQEYTAEVLLLGRDGWTRPMGSRSSVRRLPPGRVSAQLEVRMLRLPWSEPLSGEPVPSAPSSPRHEPIDSPRRVPLPTSPGARGPGGGSDQSGGPRSGRN
jgi:hypothetical protein